MASESPECFFCIPQTGLKVGFLSNGFLLATLLYRPDLWSAWHIVVTCTQWSLFATKACGSFKLPLASLISFLLAWSSSLDGLPDRGRVLVVPYAFHFLMIVLTVLQGIFKAFEVFYTHSKFNSELRIIYFLHLSLEMIDSHIFYKR